MKNPYIGMTSLKVFHLSSYQNSKMVPIERLFSIGKWHLYKVAKPKRYKYFGHRIKASALMELSKYFDLVYEVFSSKSCDIKRKYKYSIPNLEYVIESDIENLQNKEVTVMLSIYSKADGSYVGDPLWALRLIERGIYNPTTIHPTGKTSCIGKSEKDGKWYGWSHRAMYGFEIGSEVKMGDCGFMPSNKEELAVWMLNFWDGKNDKVIDCKLDYDMGPKKGVFISVGVGDLGTEQFEEYPKVWGKGEWVAKTDEDAKQMAMDFAESVS